VTTREARGLGVATTAISHIINGTGAAATIASREATSN
jgi:hypothetical protein